MSCSIYFLKNRHRILLTLIFLLFFCCDDHIICRSGADYYPVKVGAGWLYKSQSRDIYIQVEAETTWFDYDAVVFVINGIAEYRSKQPEGIYRFFDIKVPYGGFEYEIEARYRKWIELPLITGNTWEDLFYDSIDIGGVKVRIDHRINGRVIGLAEPMDGDKRSGRIEVPAGIFDDVYKVEVLNVCRINSSFYTYFDSTRYFEYYAPDVGLITFYSTGDSIFKLQEYQGL